MHLECKLKNITKIRHLCPRNAANVLKLGRRTLREPAHSTCQERNENELDVYFMSETTYNTPNVCLSSFCVLVREKKEKSNEKEQKLIFLS